jgi:hypothetical protein
MAATLSHRPITRRGELAFGQILPSTARHLLLYTYKYKSTLHSLLQYYLLPGAQTLTWLSQLPEACLRHYAQIVIQVF